jgi:hypothetical protein
MNQLILSCPPTGNTFTLSGDCDSIKSYCWSTNETGIIDYYVPRINNVLVLFDFTGVTNSGSNIIVELIYYQDGVQSIKETWDLGTLSSNVKKYHKLNFGNTPINNSLQLRVTTSGGSGGCFNVRFDCAVDVASAKFCSGTTYNPTLQTCSCGSSSFLLYAEKQIGWNYAFPVGLSGVTWYVDAELQTPAPCGNYTLLGGTTPIIYNYDCILLKSNVVRLCKNVDIDPCTGVTKTSSYTHTTYTKPNPYLPGAKNIVGNGTILYSEHSITIDYTGRADKNIIVPLTFYYSGSSASRAVVTLSDPDASPDYITGYVAYSENTLDQTPYFLPVNELTALEVLSNVEKTVWVVIPLSGLLTIRFMIGYGWLVKNPPSKITRITYPCSPTPFYGYETGLHVYSGYDALPANNPKLKTNLFSLSQIADWTVGTQVFADRQMTQPAFPYNYGYANKVYSVGVPYPNFSLKREWGTQTSYQIANKKFKTKVNEIIDGPKDWTTLVGSDFRSSACIETYMDVGKISSVTLSTNLRQPSSYLYFMGYVSNPVNIVDANNQFFTSYDYPKKKFTPLTGYEHAIWKLSSAMVSGVRKYLLSFDATKVDKFLKALQNGINTALILVGISTGAATVLGTLGVFGGKGTAFLYAALTQACGNGTAAGGLVGAGGPAAWVIALALVILALTILFFVGFTKTYREDCKLFYHKYTNGPYIELGNTLYQLSGLTGVQNGVYCDGAYFYTQQSGVITKKELSYKQIGGIKTYSVTPDNPRTVVELPYLMFLPYVSGRPQTYYAPMPYKNGRKWIILTPPIAWIGALNNPVDILYDVQEGSFYSTVSQQDADDQATSFLSGFTAATYTTITSSEDKPGTSDEQLIFTHELKIEDNSNVIIVSYQNELNTGILLGTKLYIDENGRFPCLTGYYCTTESSPSYYKKFYQVDSASTVIDIFTMQNSTDNFVTSQVNSSVVSLSNVNKDFTSFWYFTSNKQMDLTFNYKTNNLYNFYETWGTSDFYDNSIVRRGFIKTPETIEKLYLYDSNYGTASTYSEGAVSMYTDTFLLEPNIFEYITSATTVIDFDQICSLTGDTGVLFNLKDLSGNTVPSIYGVTFNADIYVSSVYDSTHEVTINSNDTETLLVLDPSYMGNITNVTISSYISPNPINNITFTEGTFTSCIAPTPSPTPTPTVTQTPTSSPITPEASYTPTPTVTPTPSTEPPPPPSYDHYYADKYDCATCTLDTAAVLVAFPSGESVNIGSWYPDTGSFSYLIINSTFDTGGYILTNSYGSFGSCAAACGL